MTSEYQKYITSIEKGLSDKKSHSEIARKIFLTFPTMALIGKEEKQFDILNKISIFFNIPITNIQVVGSAKIGISFHKINEFTPTISDLDIAIIDTSLFLKYSELVFKQTKGFSNLTKFPIKENGSTFSQYSNYIARGIFRPDLMPSSKERADWTTFFSQLSSEHNDLFKSINAGIYLSQTFFENKQRKTIKNYILQKTI